MNEHCDTKPVVLETLPVGLLAPHLEALRREFSERGYAIATSNYALRLFAAVGAWLESSGHRIATISHIVKTVRCWPFCRPACVGQTSSRRVQSPPIFIRAPRFGRRFAPI